MKDIMLHDGEIYIESNIDGFDLDLVYSDEPTYHYVFKLRDRHSYSDFKRSVNEIFYSYEDKRDGWCAVNDYLQTHEIEEFAEEVYTYQDLRTRDEISAYLKEAWDKVWLMRGCDISNREPGCEAARKGMNRIFATYKDIPKYGYDSWECGYWNGILGTLRWVLGDEKGSLDT